MKKIIASVLSILIIFSAIPVAYAANTGNMGYDFVVKESGDNEITVSMYLTDIAYFSSGDIAINYDSDILRFKGFDDENTDYSRENKAYKKQHGMERFWAAFNGSEAPGIIRCGYFSVPDTPADYKYVKRFHFVDIIFDVNAAGNTIKTNISVSGKNNFNFPTGEETIKIRETYPVTITLKNTKPEPKPEPKPEKKPDIVILMGNCDGDKKVTSADARLILRYSVQLEKFSKNKVVAADVDNDNKITAADARFVLRMSVNLEKNLKHTFSYVKSETVDGKKQINTYKCKETGKIITVEEAIKGCQHKYNDYGKCTLCGAVDRAKMAEGLKLYLTENGRYGTVSGSPMYYVEMSLDSDQEVTLAYMPLTDMFHMIVFGSENSVLFMSNTVFDNKLNFDFTQMLITNESDSTIVADAKYDIDTKNFNLENRETTMTELSYEGDKSYSEKVKAISAVSVNLGIQYIYYWFVLNDIDINAKDLGFNSLNNYILA